MGIHQLITFLKEFNHIDEENPDNNSNVVCVMPFRDLRGRTLAIDISTTLYAQMNGARRAIINSSNFNTDMMIDESDVRRVFFRNLISYMESFLRFGCSLVVVFDGEAPELKDNVRMERRARRVETLNAINKAMDEFNRTEPFDRTTDMVNNIKKLLSQEAHIPDEYVGEIKDIFKYMGFSVVQARGEAERVCSTLCKEGYVDAVVSTDSDCLVHGCPILISKILKNNEVEIIILENVLNTLNLDFKQFQELCIASGCDYNQVNGKCIPNCRIKKLYPMFNECGSFKNIVKKWSHKYDFKPVNMNKCKRLFEDAPLEELIEDEYQPPSDQIHSKLRKRLGEYDLTNHVGILLDLYAKFDDIRSNLDDEDE
jgi:5'-3' exonuclease